LTKNDEILYIGSSYKQSVEDEVQKTINRPELKIVEPAVWFGYFHENGTTVNNIPK
jgi:hypothetical protein